MSLKSHQLVIDQRAFKGKGAEATGRVARSMCHAVLETARALVADAAKTARHLPYQIKLDARTKDGARYFVVRWLHGGRSVVWHDIQHDRTLAPHVLGLLSAYNTELEELVALQSTLRAVVAATDRLGKVHRGETYNSLSKGPGAGGKRAARTANES